MLQVRFHGRGGQGVVTAAELLSVAAFIQGQHAQAFPSFGSERMGAPVMAYCRISEQPIRLREPIFSPDALIVQDASLVRNPDLLAGLDRTRVVLVNTRLSVEELPAQQLKQTIAANRIVTLPATEITMELIGRNVPNVVMLAAFGAASGVFSFETLSRAVTSRFTGKIADANLRAAERAWQLMTDGGHVGIAKDRADEDAEKEVAHA